MGNLPLRESVDEALEELRSLAIAAEKVGVLEISVRTVDLRRVADVITALLDHVDDLKGQLRNRDAEPNR